MLLNVVYARGEQPFANVASTAVLEILRAGTRPPRPRDMPAELYDTLLGCWHMFAMKRPDVEAIAVVAEEELTARGTEPLHSTPVVGAYHTMMPNAPPPAVSPIAVSVHTALWLVCYCR